MFESAKRPRYKGPRARIKIYVASYNSLHLISQHAEINNTCNALSNDYRQCFAKGAEEDQHEFSCTACLHTDTTRSELLDIFDTFSG